MILKCKVRSWFFLFFGPSKSSPTPDHPGVKPRHCARAYRVPGVLDPAYFCMLSSHHLFTPLYPHWLLAGSWPCQVCSLLSIFYLLSPSSLFIGLSSPHSNCWSWLDSSLVKTLPSLPQPGSTLLPELLLLYLSDWLGTLPAFLAVWDCDLPPLRVGFLSLFLGAN